MRLAFFGDVVGRSGRKGITDHLPALRRRLALDFVVAGEQMGEDPRDLGAGERDRFKNAAALAVRQRFNIVPA